MVTGGRPDELGHIGHEARMRALDAEVMQLEARMEEMQAEMERIAASLKKPEASIDGVTAKQREADAKSSARRIRIRDAERTGTARLELTICQSELSRLPQEVAAPSNANDGEEPHATAGGDSCRSRAESVRLGRLVECAVRFRQSRMNAAGRADWRRELNGSARRKSWRVGWRKSERNWNARDGAATA